MAIRSSIVTAAVLGILAAAGSFTANADEVYRPDPAMVVAAKKEGQVLVYTTLIVNQIVRPLISTFEKQFPEIKVEFVRSNSTAEVVRLLNEDRAGRTQADIWHLVDGAAALIQRGIAGKFELPSAKELPPGFADPNGRWVATNLSVRSLAYNSQLIPPAQAPRNYADLLQPRFKGKFVWNPTSVSGAYGFIGTVLRHMGDQKGLAYLRELSKQQITPLPIAIRAVLDRVIAGEYGIGLEMNGTHVLISAAKGAPVRWVPLDPVTMTMQVAGITAKAPHPNAARLFLDFIVSRAGQQVFRQHDYIPMHPAVPAKEPKLKPETGGYKAVMFSPEDIDNNAKHWAQIAKDIFR